MPRRPNEGKLIGAALWIKIDYIEFPTRDGPASGKFFSDAFGWKLIDYGPTYTGLDGAGIDGGIDAVHLEDCR